MMRSASRQASAALVAAQRSVFARVQGNALVDAAGEFYGIAALLVGQPRLRRTLADPATAPAGRAALATGLLDDQVGAKVLEIVQLAVSERWSSPWDLCDALEAAGDDALFAAAEADATLDDVEDELFRMERILSAEGDLTALLDEQAAPAARRIALLGSVVAGKVSQLTLELLQHAVASQRKRSLVLAVDNLLEQAAQRRERSLARVVSASPLTDAQQNRLASALGELYGRTISVRSAVDPTVRGGMVVRIGDEIIDGTVAARLAEVRHAFAG
jgi:F-type H+-transporting ATPase subunit delta